MERIDLALLIQIFKCLFCIISNFKHNIFIYCDKIPTKSEVFKKKENHQHLTAKMISKSNEGIVTQALYSDLKNRQLWSKNDNGRVLKKMIFLGKGQKYSLPFP